MSLWGHLLLSDRSNGGSTKAGGGAYVRLIHAAESGPTTCSQALTDSVQRLSVPTLNVACCTAAGLLFRGTLGRPAT